MMKLDMSKFRNSKKAFTLLELTISLFLLMILVLLLTLCLKTTIKSSEKFLDFTDYEYAMAHKKIFESYTSSKKVEALSWAIVMTNDNKEKVLLRFTGDEIYIQKKKNSSYYAGMILLLKNLSHREFSVKDDVVYISYLDRKNHKRELYIRLKDEEKEEREKKEKEDLEKDNKESSESLSKASDDKN